MLQKSLGKKNYLNIIDSIFNHFTISLANKAAKIFRFLLTEIQSICIQGVGAISKMIYIVNIFHLIIIKIYF